MPDDTDSRDEPSATDGSGDAGHRPDDTRFLLLVTIAAAVSTVVAAAASRLLRGIDDPADPVIATIATVLAVVSVLSLVTTIGAFVLWIIVRFVDRG